MKDIELKKIKGEIIVAVESKNFQLVKKLSRELLTGQPSNDKEREMNLQLEGLIAGSTMDDLEHSPDADIRSAISYYMQDNEDADFPRNKDEDLTAHLIACWWAYAELFERSSFKKTDFGEAMRVLDLLRVKNLNGHDQCEWRQIIFEAFQIAFRLMSVSGITGEEVDRAVNFGEEYLALTKDERAGTSIAALKVRLARAYLFRSAFNTGADRQKSAAHAEGVFSIISVEEEPILWAMAHEILGDIANVDAAMSKNTAVFEKAIFHYQHYLTATIGLK